MTQTQMKIWIGLLAAVGLILIFAGIFIQPLLSVARNGARAATPEGPSLQMQRSLGEKDLFAAQGAEFQAAGEQERAPRDPLNMPAFAAQASPPFRNGIIEGEPGPFYSGYFITRNAWQEQRADGFVQIFAGVTGQDPSQGALVVLLHNADRQAGREIWHLVPEKSGAIRIERADGQTLVLQSENGNLYYFDTVSLTLQTEP